MKKIQAIFFDSSRYMQRFQAIKLPRVSLGPNTLVPFVDEVKDLGVILDSKLTWKPQINLVTKKVNRALYGLRFIKKGKTTPGLLQYRIT